MLKPGRRLFSSMSSAGSWLPYNWNWQRRWPEAARFLAEHPIMLMDVGARGTAPSELESLRDHVRWVGFEADADECRRLNDSGLGLFFPNLVGGEEGPLTLNLYGSPEYSSTMELSERYKKLWLGEMPVTATFESRAVTLDGFLAEHPELSPDLLKLDTQGSELAILMGAEKALRQIGLVEVEVEFSPMYEGQPLFGEVFDFMREQGFELLYLNRTFRSRREVYRGPSRGQIFDADALFGKREDSLDVFSLEQLAKYVILLCQYGHMDIAWQLTQESPEVVELVPGMASVFRPASHPALRGTVMQLDKLLAVLLHLRRYNQRGMDTDRAWPIR